MSDPMIWHFGHDGEGSEFKFVQREMLEHMKPLIKFTQFTGPAPAPVSRWVSFWREAHYRISCAWNYIKDAVRVIFTGRLHDE